ncbi:hypothetical protein R1sor_023169 [Riccia sorocarpa]|uniref:Reverse transcriptase domain-containing protein n=1 Tax=Riccia sorocarpa TaxID=122646 RepID=A0ABD3GMP5_9MARC
MVLCVWAKKHIVQADCQGIQVERGVRQGCPLAPLLFSLCSQSLMSLIRAASQRDDLKGLKISPRKSLTHQLFANDVGICLPRKVTSRNCSDFLPADLPVLSLKLIWQVMGKSEEGDFESLKRKYKAGNGKEFGQWLPGGNRPRLNGLDSSPLNT